MGCFINFSIFTLHFLRFEALIFFPPSWCNRSARPRTEPQVIFIYELSPAYLTGINDVHKALTKCAP